MPTLSELTDCDDIAAIIGSSHSEGLSYILEQVNTSSYLSTLDLSDTNNLNILIDSIKVYSFQYLLNTFGAQFDSTNQVLVSNQNFPASYFLNMNYAPSSFPSEVTSIINNVNDSTSLRAFGTYVEDINELLLAADSSCINKIYLAVLNDSYDYWSSQEAVRKCKLTAADVIADASGAYDLGVFGTAVGGPVGGVFGAINGAIIASSTSFLLGCITIF